MISNVRGKILARRLAKLRDKTDTMIEETQSRIRAGRNTQDLEFIMRKAGTKNNKSKYICIDLKKAFDRVNENAVRRNN